MSGSPTRPKAHGGTHRLFFALWPDEDTRARIAATADRLRAHAAGGRWVPPERYHLTLQFLGTFRRRPTPVVEAASAAAAQVRSPALTVQLDRIGIFPGRPRLWWLGREDPGPLLPLWNNISCSLLERGISGDSPTFVPHVTLARGMTGAPPQALSLPVTWEAEDFVLIHSQSAAETRYTVLGKWPLRCS
ncbi:MAG: RNA 2',3'-cyclic phosphodiesterase [Pseudomonadota bacterium]|nr:RNA 2',3'-cyclic phosphodiesterase [Pseudomonadota bacterium]